MSPSRRIDKPAIGDDEALEPAAMLALADAQAERTTLAHTGLIAGMLAAWAVAWGFGFFAIWLTASAPGAPGLAHPAVGIVVFAALTAGAIVLSLILGRRMSRGLRGPSGFSAAVYGWFWPLMVVGITVLGAALGRAGLGSDALWVYYPAAYALVVGILYFLGAAIWHDLGQLLLGVWLVVSGAGASLLGFPDNLLAMAIVGGGGFAVGAIVFGTMAARSKRAGRGRA